MEQFEKGGNCLVVIVGWVFVNLVDMMPQFVFYSSFPRGSFGAGIFFLILKNRKTVQPSLSSLSVDQINQIIV